MQFEFDEAKNNANLEKQRLQLDISQRVLEDPDRIKKSDNRKDYGETRVI